MVTRMMFSFQRESDTCQTPHVFVLFCCIRIGQNEGVKHKLPIAKQPRIDSKAQSVTQAVVFSALSSDTPTTPTTNLATPTTGSATPMISLATLTITLMTSSGTLMINLATPMISSATPMTSSATPTASQKKLSYLEEQSRHSDDDWFEVRELAGASSDEVINVFVSCDSTWQRRGHSSLFGAIFIVTLTTGMVIDYHIKSEGLGASTGKHGTRARQSSYVQWKENYALECSMNFDGSEPPMDQHGTVITGIQTHLISDGDRKPSPRLPACNCMAQNIQLKSLIVLDMFKNA